MKVTRLKLSRETLRELTPRDLRAAVGGELTPFIRTIPPAQCVVTYNVSCVAAECNTPAP